MLPDMLLPRREKGEPGEIAQSWRDLSTKIIVGEVHFSEPTKVTNSWRYLPGEPVSGDVKGGKHRERTDARRDGTRQVGVVAEVEAGKVREGLEPQGVQRSHEVGTREGERGDGLHRWRCSGSALVATGEAGPVAWVDVAAPCLQLVAGVVFEGGLPVEKRRRLGSQRHASARRRAIG